MADTKDHLAKADWAGEQGERWLANVERLEAMLSPIGEALLARADYGQGESVIDIGCGGGASTRAIGRSVVPNGSVIGVDISQQLIEYAVGLSEGEPSIAYHYGDAATFAGKDEPFDRLHSRFGSMFFDDPKGAFSNLHSLLKPDARIDLAVWAHPRENPWMMEMMRVVRGHVEVPPAEPRAPGPFAFEDLDYLREILTEGGFRGMDAQAYQGHQAIVGAYSNPEEATQFVLSTFGVGQIVAEQEESVRNAITADMQAMFQRNFVSGKGVLLGCKAWLVSARA